MVAEHFDALLVHHALVVHHFHGELAVLGRVRHVGEERDLFAKIGRKLRHTYAGKVTVAIDDHHLLAGNGLAGQDLLRRQAGRKVCIAAIDRTVAFSAEAIGLPVRAGGDDHLVCAIVQNLIGRHFADAQMNFDILHLRQLNLAIGDDAAPLVQARIADDIAQMPSKFRCRLAQMHVIAAFAQHARAFHA